MQFGPKRGNPLIIFEHFLRDFGLLMVFILLLIFGGSDFASEFGEFVVFAVARPIVALWNYIFTRYSVDNNNIKVASGCFVKKVVEIPLGAVTTVDLSQSLLFQLFHVYKIAIDNASQSNDNARKSEVKLVLKHDLAVEFKQMIDHRHGSHIDTMVSEEQVMPKELPSLEGNVIKADSLIIFLLGVFQSKLLYLALLLPMGLIIIEPIVEHGDNEKAITDFFSRFTTVGSIVLLVTVVFIVYYLASTIFASLSSFLKYYNYTVTNTQDAFYISFGLFTKRSYTLKKEKISGIIIKQPILMRIFGYCSLDVFIIGYGDTDSNGQQEKSMLYPIVKMSEVDSLLGKLFPGISFAREYHIAKPEAFRYFCYSFRMLLGILILVVTTAGVLVYDIPKGYVAGSILFLALVFVTIIMEYNNAGIRSGNEMISIRNGVFVRKFYFIKLTGIESMAAVGGPWKRKKGYASIRLGFLGPLRVANVKVRNMRQENFEEVLQVVMKYN